MENMQTLIENEMRILEEINSLEQDFSRDPNLRIDKEFLERVFNYNTEIKRAKCLAFLDSKIVEGYEKKYQNLQNNIMNLI